MRISAEPFGTQRPVGEAGAALVTFRPQPVLAAESPNRHSPSLLFLCVANSFRSQIAEAWARSLAPWADTQSAGLEPSRVHPLAEGVMREAGIELTGHYSKAITPGMLAKAGVVVTVCAAPLGWFPQARVGARQEHWPFPDPTANAASEAAALAEARAVRDGIRRRVEGLLASLSTAS